MLPLPTGISLGMMMTRLRLGENGAVQRDISVNEKCQVASIGISAGGNGAGMGHLRASVPDWARSGLCEGGGLSKW